MEKKFNKVHYHEVSYKQNQETGWFTRLPEIIPFTKLPLELRIENTREPRLVSQGANQIITGKIKKGKRTFFSGLRPIGEGFYFGDDYRVSNGIKTNSICVFQIIDPTTIVIFYFNNYFIDNPTSRIKFVQEFIEFLKSKG